MTVATFRTRLRRLIFDEDVQLNVFSVERASGSITVTSTAIVGKATVGGAEEFNLAFATYTTYNSIINAINAVSNWTCTRNESCVGTKTVELALMAETLVTNKTIVYANHFFHNDEIDDMASQAIDIWEDSLETGYTSTSDFPDAKMMPLLWISASIAMTIRAVQDAVSFYEYYNAGVISSVSFGGDLSIAQGGANVSEDGQISWISLSKYFDKKWINYLGRAADRGAFPEISEIEKLRVVRETGKLPYDLDKGLDAVTGLAASVSGSTVVLTWDRRLSEQFAYYSIQRDGTELDKEFDVQDATYTDSSVSAGTYTYTVYVYDLNEIASPATSISVTVA